MLDIFGNVFGRSKAKASPSAQQNTTNGNENHENADGFVLLGQTNNSFDGNAHDDHPPLYPTTMLTDEMLRTVPNTSASSTAASPAPHSRQMNPQRQHSTPIDNVPFMSMHSATTNSITIATNLEVNKCCETIERIGQFLYTPSQSEYNFHLENNILRESQFS